MIEAPAYLKTPHYRLYKDIHDLELSYVDALQPSAVHSAGVVIWQTSPASERAYFVSEVQFGATEAGFKQASSLQDYQRVVPVPWESSPVYTWFKQQGTNKIIASGNTSGFGSHNAVMQGVAHSEVASLPAVVAGELFYKAKLAGAKVRADGDRKALQRAIAKIPLSDRAPWNATVADVLLPVLRELVEQEQLIVQAESVSLSIESLIELKALVLMEWAHRIVQNAAIKSLAFPATQVQSLPIKDSLLLKIHWAPGDLIPVRVVRTLCPEEVIIPPISVVPDLDQIINVSISADSDWSNFNYVQINSSDPNQGVILTPAQPVQSIKAKDAFSVVPIGNVKGYGVDIEVERKVKGQDMIVHLRRLEEQAFLVKAERTLLEKIGELHVAIAHPALARTLLPKDGNLLLSAKNGDLPMVSAAYRGLFWHSKSSEPYTLTVSLASDGVVQWQDFPSDGNLVIESARLPLLKVTVAPQSTADSTTVEVGQGEAHVSLGVKEISPHEFAIWSYDPAQSVLWIRAQYHASAQTPYWTAWHATKADGMVLAPRVRSRQVVLMASSTLEQPLSVEVAPALGEGGVAHVAIRAGQVVPLNLLNDEQGSGFQYRVCEDSDWSSWISINSNVIKL